MHRNGPLLLFAVLLGLFAYRRSQASGADSRGDWALSLSESQENEASLPRAILVHPDRGTPSLAKGPVCSATPQA